MLARDGGGVMSRRFRASSGSYNVRASEIAREKQERRMRCLVAFLDDSEHIFEVEVNKVLCVGIGVAHSSCRKSRVYPCSKLQKQEVSTERILYIQFTNCSIFKLYSGF